MPRRRVQDEVYLGDTEDLEVKTKLDADAKPLSLRQGKNRLFSQVVSSSMASLRSEGAANEGCTRHLSGIARRATPEPELPFRMAVGGEGEERIARRANPRRRAGCDIPTCRTASWSSKSGTLAASRDA